MRGRDGRQRARRAKAEFHNRSRAATVLQRNFRRVLANLYIARMQFAAVRVQSLGRGFLARTLLMRCVAAAVRIQSLGRGHAGRLVVRALRVRNFLALWAAAGQACAILARVRFRRRRAKAASLLTRLARGFVARMQTRRMQQRREAARLFIVDAMKRNGIGSSVQAQAATLEAELG